MHLAAWLASFVPVVLQFVVRMCNISMVDMPDKACLFPRTTKKEQ